MRFLLFFILVILVLKQSYNQVETAMNWTKEDCNTGATTTLFDVLDSNIIVVQEYIMTTCTPCISAGDIIQDMLVTYELLYPGKVVGYQTGHNDDLTCDDMLDWASDNDFNLSSLFTMGATEIDYYGIMGMPTLLVLGGSAHKVFLYHLGLISAIELEKALQAAIDSALVATGVPLITQINSANSLDQVLIYPTLAQNILNIEFNDINNEMSIEVTDFVGHHIQSLSLYKSAGIDITNYPAGLYFVTIQDSFNRMKTFKFIKFM